MISFGNQSLLPQHGIDHATMKPLLRVIEARAQMRDMLDNGALSYEGEFRTYKGLWTLARPVQSHLPIKIGAMGGPRSFEVGGELFDGGHQAIGCSRETYEYMMSNVKAGAEKAGVIGASSISPHGWSWLSAKTRPRRKETARIMVAFYLASMPESQSRRHGITSADPAPIFDAFGARDVQKALDLTSPELGETLSVAGTPAGCLDKLQRDILATGIKHIVAALVDPYLVKAFTGRDIDGCPDSFSQLQLMADRMMPALNANPA